MRSTAACDCSRRFGPKKLAAIERADVRAWLTGMAELVDADEIGPKTINNALTALSVCRGWPRTMV